MPPLAQAVIGAFGTAEPGQMKAGPAVWIRPLDQSDLIAIERHLLAFGPADRHARFGMLIQDAAITAYVQRVDLSRAILVGAVDEESGDVLGLAEAQPALTPNRVEMAVSVHAAYRRCGLGQRLLRQAMLEAFACGAEAAEFIFSPENRPVLSLVRKLGAQVAATFDRAELLCTP